MEEWQIARWKVKPHHNKYFPANWLMAVTTNYNEYSSFLLYSYVNGKKKLEIIILKNKLKDKWWSN